MWVGYELVKVLQIFGLQPTGIREDVQSWSPDLYALFMYFKDKKENASNEKRAQQIMTILFDETDHDGHFSAVKFGSKSNIEKMRQKTLFLVILTWLRQLQQFFYNCSERLENRNWSDYGNYCPTVSYHREAPLANIRFGKGEGKEKLVTSVDAFKPKKDHVAILSLEEWALRILKPDYPHILRRARKSNNETRERFIKAKKWEGPKFRFTNKNLATNFKDKEAQDKYDDLDTDATQNWGKGKDELVNIINTAIGDVLSKAEKKKSLGKKMSKKIVAEMKNVYDAASAMTVLVNKEFETKYDNFYRMRSGMEDELSNKRKRSTDDEGDEDVSKNEDDDKSEGDEKNDGNNDDSDDMDDD
jgi:hypothetical protein